MRKSIPVIVPAVIWLLLVTTLLCIPGSQLPKAPWENKIWFDKWIHLVLFMVLVVVWCRAYSDKRSLNTRKHFVIITIVAVIYGILMEIIQHYFIPQRFSDPADVVFNCLGSLSGYFISIKRFRKKTP